MVNSTGKIEYNLGADRLKIRDVRTPDLIVDEMDIHIEGGDEIIEKLFSVGTLAKGDGKPLLAPLYALQQAPKEIESFQVRIPEDAASRALVAMRKESLAEEGISDIAVSFEEGNEMSLSGKAHKIVDIPFHISGRLSLGEDHKIRYSVERMDLLGLIPLPHIFRTLALALAHISGADKGIQRNGASYIVDLQSLVPEKMQIPVNSVETKDGFLILAGKG